MTRENTSETLTALQLGAVDFVAKPVNSHDGGFAGRADDIIEKVKVAAAATVRPLDKDTVHRIQRDYKASVQPRTEGDPVSAQDLREGHVLAIGASTGGVEAITEVLMQMPEHCPPIVITQHIPPVFSASYAKRLNQQCPIRVCEAEDGQTIEPGAAYIAPGSHHLLFERHGLKLVCRLSDAERVNLHRPSVEVMFDSLRNVQGNNCTAALLTGMGSDGAQALLRMHQSGIHTIAQNQATCVVWGMPAAAVELNAASEVVPLGEVTHAMLSAATRH